jgi:hypothetical protein
MRSGASVSQLLADSFVPRGARMTRVGSKRLSLICSYLVETGLYYKGYRQDTGLILNVCDRVGSLAAVGCIKHNHQFAFLAFTQHFRLRNCIKPVTTGGPGHDRFKRTALDATHATGSVHRQASVGNPGSELPWLGVAVMAYDVNQFDREIKVNFLHLFTNRM